MTLGVTPGEIVSLAEASGNAGLLAVAPGWPRVRLSSVANIINGAPFESEKFNKAGVGMPLIRIRDVGASAISTWYDGRWNEIHRVRAGDLLVGMDGDFRASLWRGPDGLLNQRVCKIVVTSDDYAPEFLRYVLPGYLDAVWAATSSVTVKHLSSRSLGELPLPSPPIGEQLRIVSILEDHFSRIEAAEAMLSSARGRSESLRVARLQQLLPKGVQRIRLGALASSSGYGTSTKCIYGGPGAAVVRIPNLVDGQIDLSDEKRVAGLSVGVDGLKLDAGDLLVVRTNGSRDLIGRTAVVQEGIDASFASYLIRFKLDRSTVEPGWVHLVMADPSMRRIIESLAASSAGQYNLSLAKLNGLDVQVPSLEVQRQILHEMDDLNRTRARLVLEVQRASMRAARLRRAALVAAFSGELTGAASDADRIEELAEAIDSRRP